jgi:hypothetical protein
VPERTSLQRRRQEPAELRVGRAVGRVATVAFEGIEARAADVQVQVAPGPLAFNRVGCQCPILTGSVMPRSFDVGVPFVPMKSSCLAPAPAFKRGLKGGVVV